MNYEWIKRRNDILELVEELTEEQKQELFDILKREVINKRLG